VTGVLERAASAFIAPAPPASAPAAPAASPVRSAPRALVFGSARDALPVAAALAAGLREREAAAVLVAWPHAEAPRAALGTPGATRLGAGLRLRGLEAVARGRLAWVALGDDELGLARRAFAVDAPVVVGISGPRTAATDALLAEADHVVVVLPENADPRLVELAVAGLHSAVVRGPLTAPGARAAALAGWGRLKVSA
jgi:hypothetical protein